MTPLTSTKTKHLPGILNCGHLDAVCFYENIMVPIPSHAEITQATWIHAQSFCHCVRPGCIVNAQNVANRGDIIRTLQRDFCVIMSKRKKNPKGDEYKEKMSDKRTGKHDEGSCSGNVNYITVQRLSSTVEGKCQNYYHIGALTMVPLGCKPTLNNIKTACTNHFNLQEMECDLLTGAIIDRHQHDN